ncbi:MAG: OmpA family protein [Treponema sp.]|nr:OmpA family protein [Treponema sp.]
MAKPELLLGVDPKELKDFTPDGDGEGDTITFRPSTKYLARAAESWSLKILEPNGNTFRTWTGGGNPPEEIVWDGKGDQGEGVFSYNIYKAQLQVVPSAKDKERLGMESLEASVQGSVEIKTGIVLERSGPDEWKIEMTSLPFDPNGATFNNLNVSQRAELNKTVDDIYKKVLSIGSAAKVRVNGYGNNLSGTDKEEKEDVLPLSQARAQMMADLLVQRGIEAQSVSAVGRGSADPIAARDDRSNWWKNRRVEFIISR